MNTLVEHSVTSFAYSLAHRNCLQIFSAQTLWHRNSLWKIMARSNSVAAPMLFIAAAAYVLSCCRSAPSFVAPPKAAEAALQQQQQAAVVSATLAAASMPAPAWAARASDEDDEGFDVRIIAVLALPLFAISWALFNVWRVAFRQVVRQGENAKGNAL